MFAVAFDENIIFRFPACHGLKHSLNLFRHESRSTFPAFGVNNVYDSPVKINMIFVRFSDPALAGREGELVERLAAQGVVTYPPENGWVRFVTHHDVERSQVEEAAGSAAAVVESMKKPG